jgi:hypothetical protein
MRLAATRTAGKFSRTRCSSCGSRRCLLSCEGGPWTCVYPRWVWNPHGLLNSGSGHRLIHHCPVKQRLVFPPTKHPSHQGPRETIDVNCRRFEIICERSGTLVSVPARQAARRMAPPMPSANHCGLRSHRRSPPGRPGRPLPIGSPMPRSEPRPK